MRFVFAVCAFGALCACRNDLSDVDTIFYAGGHRDVHCGLDIDARAQISRADLDDGLDRARDRGEAIELYAHKPGDTVPLDLLEYTLAGAADRGLAFLTYRELATEAPTGPAIAFSFDDSSVDLWVEQRAMFAKYGARLTFFVSRYSLMDDAQHAGLAQLAADGHDIEAHTVNHLHGPEYVENNGLDAYMTDEVVPSIDVLRDAGFDPVAFAYPFGQRTSEMDRAILSRVSVIRSIAFAWDPVSDPCPL